MSKIQVTTTNGEIRIELEDTNWIMNRTSSPIDASDGIIVNVQSESESLLVQALRNAQRENLTFRDFLTAHTQSVTIYIDSDYNTYYRSEDGYVSTDSLLQGLTTTIIGTGQLFLSDEDGYLVCNQGNFYIISGDYSGRLTQMTQLDLSDPEMVPRVRKLIQPRTVYPQVNLKSDREYPEIRNKLNSLENNPIGRLFDP